MTTKIVGGSTTPQKMGDTFLFFPYDLVTNASQATKNENKASFFSNSVTYFTENTLIFGDMAKICYNVFIKKYEGR